MEELLGRVFGGEATISKVIENVVFGQGEEEDWAAWSLMQVGSLANILAILNKPPPLCPLPHIPITNLLANSFYITSHPPTNLAHCGVLPLTIHDQCL
ncbi:hypothetical protein L873DRAFT_107580 [Choiromyces venosus 120613-1]|uniref:Uncharacterized protein n=1 Tax=Choiromyces venosus 120613-1 TaxID=1336337 RepID=A0A3N4J755_9PEZI|nr:hypothetical protein L873DRAFT_107580 [Choiromyces venosus 120613-1]